MQTVPAVARNKYLIFGLLYLGWCISFIDRSAISLGATQLMAELTITPVQMGLVLSSFYIGYSLMQLPGGWLADRFGSRIVVICAIAFWSVFTIISGLAGSFASLLVIRFLFGLGEGAFPSASVKGVVERFSSDEKPKVSSLLMSSNYIGSMIAPLMIAPMLLIFGWRHVFFIIGAAGLVFVVIYALATRGHTPQAATEAGKAQSRAGFRQVLRNPLLWKITGVWFGLSLINKGLDSWMPIYLLTERGLNLKSVGLLLPLPFLVAGIASAIGGWVMVRFFEGREKYLMMGSIALTAVFLYLMYNAHTIPGLIAAQAGAYLFKSFVLAAVVALPTKLMPTTQMGSSIGLINTGGMAAGFIAPTVIGLLVGASGYNAAFIFLIGAAVFSLCVASTLRTPGASGQNVARHTAESA